MNHKHYDLVILGAGSAGIAAARKAEKLKIKTVLINAGLPIMGTCLNVGCIPSKKLIYAADILHYAHDSYVEGLSLQVNNFSFSKVIQATENLVKRWRKHAEEEIKNFKYIDYINGFAEFRASDHVKVEDTIFYGKKILIATGSSTCIPKSIKGIEQAGYITHEQALFLRKQPKSLIIVGAGAIGLEFAQIYSRFGTEVTILEYSDTIFRKTEKELAARLQALLELENIIIKTNAKVTKAKKIYNQKIVTYIIDNNEYQVTGEEILIATGITPNTTRLNLEIAGVAVNHKKAVNVNNYLQTSNPDIYAVGDVSSMPKRIKTTASQEGSYAVENMFLNAKKTINYNIVPFSLFTEPALALIGLSKSSLLKGNNSQSNYDFITMKLEYNTRAYIEGHTQGLIKIIVHKKTREIKGVHILAPQAQSIIAQAMVIMYNKNTVDDVLAMLPVFPTYSEYIRQALLRFYT